MEKARWRVQDSKSADLSAGTGVVLRNFSLEGGYGFEDYLLCVDGKVAEAIEELKAAVEANLRRAERLQQSILSQAFDVRL